MSRTAHNQAELLALRAQLMARAQEYNAIGYSLASSTSMQSTCTAIEHSGMAKGLLEAVEALDKMLFAVRAANDNHTA